MDFSYLITPIPALRESVVGCLIWGCLIISTVDRLPADDAERESPTSPKNQQPQAQDDIEAAFYSPYTPTELRICSSQEVLSLLNLSDQQLRQLSRLQEEWRNEYRIFQSDRQAFIEKWRIGTGGPRGELRKKFEAILTQEQRQVYDKIRIVWSWSPVRSDSALGYAKTLQLRLKQQKRLRELEGKWVQTAWPQIKDARSTVGFHSIALLAWKFKEERDEAWRQILTKKQAKRWQQIEFQQQLLAAGAASYLQSLLYKDYAARMKGELPRTVELNDYFVPYFDSPMQVLELNQQQQEDIIKLCGEQIQAEKQIPAIKSQDYETREAYIAARKARIPQLAKLSRQTLLRMEELLTEVQKQKWREMLGEPYVPTLEDFFP